MRKEIKGFVCGVLSTVVVSVGIVSASGTWENIPVLRNDIKVIVDGTEVTADNFLYQDATYLPIRAISAALGEKVEYDEAANTAYIGERIDNLDNTIVAQNKYSLPDDILNKRECWDFAGGQYFLTGTGVWEYAQKYGLSLDGEDVNGKFYWIFKKNDIEVYRYHEEFVDGALGVLFDNMVDIIIPVLESVQ